MLYAFVYVFLYHLSFKAFEFFSGPLFHFDLPVVKQSNLSSSRIIPPTRAIIIFLLSFLSTLLQINLILTFSYDRRSWYLQSLSFWRACLRKFSFFIAIKLINSQAPGVFLSFFLTNILGKVRKLYS